MSYISFRKQGLTDQHGNRQCAKNTANANVSQLFKVTELNCLYSVFHYIRFQATVATIENKIQQKTDDMRIS